jgi:hypothetical protein
MEVRGGSTMRRQVFLSNVERLFQHQTNCFVNFEVLKLWYFDRVAVLEFCDGVLCQCALC